MSSRLARVLHAAGTRRAGAMLVALAAVLSAARPAAPQQRPVLDRADASRARGHHGAPVLVIEIADFQCPYCARFSRDVFPRLDSAYVRPGKVKWLFVNLPMPSLHPRAWAAAEAALCAGAVADRFWDFHDRLFDAQEEWAGAPDPLPIFLAYARDAAIPIEPFEDCLIDDAVASLLLKDVIFTASTRVSGTPTFVIDMQTVVVGVKSFEEWTELLDGALRKKEGAKRR